MFCEMFFFFFTNLSQGNFLYCSKFFILTKNLNTAFTPTEMKQNFLNFFSLRFFFSFIKLLNINLDEYSLFLSHVKSDFLMMIGTEQKRLY